MEAMVETIKVRVPAGTRGALEEMADRRHLEMSDVVREALRDYVEKNDPPAGKAEEVVS